MLVMPFPAQKALIVLPSHLYISTPPQFKLAKFLHKIWSCLTYVEELARPNVAGSDPQRSRSIVTRQVAHAKALAHKI